MSHPTPSSNVAQPHDENVNRYAVARALRTLDRCTLVVVGLLMLGLVVVVMLGSPPHRSAWTLVVLAFIQSVGVLPMYRLDRALGESAELACLRAVSTLVPILGVVAMALQVSHGASVLARFGILLPIFGLRRHHLEALRSEYCPCCGYDIRSTRDRKCPECGEPNRRRPAKSG